jgi:1-aminocyclopropane-1-carboxylate deaminase
MVVAFAVFLSCIRSYSVATDRVASRVSKHVYAGREFYVKRDDENSLSGPALSSVSGNKSRKLLHLSKMKPFPDILASYGGSQSNSMLAIAKVTASSSVHNDFFYFMKPLPKFLKNCPTGNLKAALDLGMQVPFA